VLVYSDVCVVPALLDVRIASVTIFAPHRERVTSLHRLRHGCQFCCFCLVPRIEIVGVPTNIGRIEIDKVLAGCFAQCILPAGNAEGPRFALHLLRHPRDLVGDFADVPTALLGLTEAKPDLVFLDVELKGGTTCFDLLEQIDSPPPFQIIFTTGHSEHAVRAFKYSALHYLEKPVRELDIAEAVQRCIEKQEYQHLGEKIQVLGHNMEAGSGDQMIAISAVNGGNRYVNIREIVRFEGARGGYSDVVLSNKEVYSIARSLKDCEELLNNGSFMRVHDSHLVHRPYIAKSLKKGGMLYLLLRNGDEIPVSARKRKMFNESFTKL